MKVPSKRDRNLECLVKNLGIGLFFVGPIGLFIMAYDSANETQAREKAIRNSQLTVVEQNGYTRLGDIDLDGQWDMIEQRKYGADGSHKFIYKEGFGPNGPMPSDSTFEHQPASFFEPYQHVRK